MREYLKNVAVYYKGDYFKISNHVENKLDIESIDYDGNFITILDPQYPMQLKALQDPPYVLFYEGNLSLLRLPMISIVGSRLPSSYSKEITEKLVMKLKTRYAIVSGLARGIDGIAHKTSLDAYTIAVLGNGTNIYYPKEHEALQNDIKNNHLLISEYPKNTKPEKSHFPTRNRIIAALGSKLIVTSARLRSGTVCTVNHALSINREVIALPHSILDISGKGCNELIQEGASMLTNLDDLSNI